jgi:hypothetical protein
MAFVEASIKTPTANEILLTMQRTLIQVRQWNLRTKKIPVGCADICTR